MHVYIGLSRLIGIGSRLVNSTHKVDPDVLLSKEI